MTYLTASLSALWLAVFWLLTRDRITTKGLIIGAMFASIISVGLASSGVWSSVQKGYPNDSFWTLGIAGRLGVLAISTIGITLVFLILAWKTNFILRLKMQISATAWVLFDTALGMLMFGVIHTISPQIFYSFYRLIFDNLPNQWVIDGLLDTDRLSMIARLPIDGSLSAHLAGAALWAVVPFTVWLHLRHWWRG